MDEPKNALKSRLAARLRAGRGGSFHRKTIDSIFGKITPQESRVLSELIGHLEADAKRDGARDQRRAGPHRRV